MEEILRSLQMETLFNRFRAQRMEPQSTLAASDQELVRLGVTTIGDRIRLRDACKKKIDDDAALPNQLSAAREERLSIFNPRRHNSRTNARAAARSTTSGANRRASKSHPWTPTFFCLADSTASKAPSAIEKQILFKAGLGLKKIKLDLQDDEQTVIGKITSETQDTTGNSLGFPQLKECGGFELLRCTSNCRDLSVISCSWNAKDLRSALGGGQGKIYLRPIQKSLSTQPLVAQSQCEVKEKCHMCNQEILVRRLRDHLWSCTEGLQSEDDENTSTTNVISETSNVSTTLTNATLGSPSFVADTSEIPQQTSPNAPIILQTPNSNPVITLPTPPADLPAIASQQSPEVLETVDLTQPEENHLSQTLDEAVNHTVNYCNENSVLGHVEILRCFQQKVIVGRSLEVENVAQAVEGETNYINVDRNNLIETAFEEIKFLDEYRKTLEVQFYGEVRKTPCII